MVFEGFSSGFVLMVCYVSLFVSRVLHLWRSSPPGSSQLFQSPI